MNMMIYISKYIVPFMIMYIILYGIAGRVKIYDEFVKGAKEALGVVGSICPVLVGLMVATGILRRSGALLALINIMEPLLVEMSFPIEVAPVLIIKLFSSSAATGLLVDIYKEYGTDSYVGTLASVCLASSETVFYTMSIYYASVGVTKTRWTLVGALLATLVGTVVSVWVVGGMMC